MEPNKGDKNRKQPLVSIALCTFNGANYLAELLNSLLSQTYSPLEIIAVDDCSTDRTFNILKKYETEHPHLFKLHQNSTNLGFTKNFEKAISLCTGEYIAPCDQDDIWVKDKVQLLVNNIDNHDLIYHDSRFIDDHGHDMGEKLSDTINMHQGKSNYFFLTGNAVSGHAMLFKKKLKNYIFPFDERFYHDWWIAFVATSVGEIKYLDIPLVYHRRHNEGITSGSGKDKELPMAHVHKNDFFEFNLEWISYLSEFKHAKNRKDISFIAKTLQDSVNGKKGWRLFFFIHKYLRFFTYIPRKKNFLSRINLSRKLYKKFK